MNTMCMRNAQIFAESIGGNATLVKQSVDLTARPEQVNARSTAAEFLNCR